MILSPLLPPDLPTGLWLGTSNRAATTDSTFEVEDPATGEVLATVADADSADWNAALDAAMTAQQQWAPVTSRRRSEMLSALFSELTRRTEDFARVMTLEMGKPLAEARGEVAYGAEYFRWFAEEAVRIPGRYATAPSGLGQLTVTRTPVGPVLAITPWNFPLAMATRKIAPALAAGCPVIVKPAAETPLTMLLLGEVFAEVFGRFNVPEGLVSIIPTTHAAELSAELMSDPRLRKVTFTGSTPVGRQLVRQSAENLLHTSMELGGNAPFVVAADADLDLAIEGAIFAKMRNGGEACTAANRIYVDQSVANEFTTRLVERIAGYQPGHGLDETTTLGPIITERQLDRIAALVDAAVEAGATVATGGHKIEGAGNFFQPTVLTEVPAGQDILTQEIFGPVVTITTFDGLEEGVTLANDTEFGLAAYGFSSSTQGAAYLSTHLQAGMIGINRAAISDPAAPFGGIGQSGFGREGGIEGIEEYLDVKYIATS
ncbi:NAD-dependent succinate-semialdehyde dehydrogenase [Corynebacterium alimapuense]|uniref:NAD-dependent succinate-semialdehyde dehydrogenase n=1 Tax=Corynebacterium alimapuense TaxID=1576874 RepID=A0A3M8K5X0_9CORY|nr:NAD-dependent succinate-semialdehyde dehydrogenase [Corynebacterium alimapuense]RNE48576.1 NAD-dependent succinate-semialdehyde dehydrogenase [Corynebacterium alimapuense]